MTKIANRLADSGFAKVEIHNVTPCELWDKVKDNRIVEVYGLEYNFDNYKMLISFINKGMNYDKKRRYKGWFEVFSPV